MKLVRIARNLILARIAWRLVAARRRKALARERRNRRIGRMLLAGGAGVAWATRPRILAGARRLLVAAQSRLDKNEQALHRGERQPPQPHASSEAHAARPGESIGSGGERAPARATPPTAADDRATRTARGHGSRGSAGTNGPGRPQPKPSPKKRRQRARRAQAAQRQNAERESTHGGKVNVEVNEPEELRAPLGELKH
jgi:hypothetical protein